MSDSTTDRSASAPAPDDGADSLRPGARVAEFEIRQVLGAGGFGIVYRAWDEALLREVALKEYMPVSMAGRGSGERVTLRSRNHQDSFALGLQSFVNEARLLARFDQPALVKVLRFWEANGTAYMAMPLYKGQTLRQLRRGAASDAFDEAWVRALVDPLLDALEVMHAAEVYHRDIAPDNILWCDDNRPVLLDFGAARLVLADRTQDLTAILKPQFAPIEQYAETPAMRQGPWTDLYALASTCYYMLTGRAPMPATARVLADDLEPLAQLAPAGCSPQLLQALDWAMAVRPQDRPQSVAQWRDALAGRIAAPVRAPAARAGTGAGAGDDADYEKTVQFTRRVRAPAPTPAPAAKPSRHEIDDDLPERSVVLPPKSRVPMVTVALLLAVAAAAAGAWATRPQWMPLLGLSTPVKAAAPAASAAEGMASSAASDAASAPTPVADAASAASSATAPASVASAAVTASAPATFQPVPAAKALIEPEPEPPSAVSPRPRATVRARPQDARPAGFVLPPPTLPPAPVSDAPPAAATASAPGPATEPAAAAPGPRPLRGPREVCMDRDPTNPVACVKRLCESEPRYKFYPACLRVQRKEER